ncbi:MAG: STAS domain-containing protein [Planctomycetota bacterium]
MPVDWSETVCVAHLADDPAFSDELDTLTHALEEDPRHAVLDMEGVTFLNSSNLAQLVGLRKLLQETDCRVIIASVADELWKTFELSRLDRLFERCESVALSLAKITLDA